MKSENSINVRSHTFMAGKSDITIGYKCSVLIEASTECISACTLYQSLVTKKTEKGLICNSKTEGWFVQATVYRGGSFRMPTVTTTSS